MPGGVESEPGEAVVDQVAVQPAVAVLEGMNIDKAEGENRRGHHGIELRRSLSVECDHAFDEPGQVLWASADVVGDRHARLAIPFADETALAAQSETDETGIADHDALQAQQFVEIDRLPARLADGPAPPLNAVLGWMLAFDGEAGPGILQQQKGRRSRQQVLGDRVDGLLRARLEFHRREAVQRPGAEHERTELRRTGQVVLDPVSPGDLGAGRKLTVRIDDRRVGSTVGVRQIEPVSGQPFIQKPDTSGVGARGLGPDESLDGCRAGRGEQALENGEVQTLVLQGEGEVAFKAGIRRMARRIDAPAAFFDQPVSIPRRAQHTRERYREFVCPDQRGVSGRDRSHWEPLFLKNGNRS